MVRAFGVLIFGSEKEIDLRQKKTTMEQESGTLSETLSLRKCSIVRFILILHFDMSTRSMVKTLISFLLILALLLLL